MSVVRRLVAVFLAAAIIAPVIAGAETVASLKSQLDRLKEKTAAAGRDFSNAYWKLDETEVRLVKNQARLKRTEKQLAAAKRRLNRRANDIYRRDQLILFNFLVGSSSFEEFTTRAEYLSRIGAADAEAVAEVKRLRRQLVTQKRNLTAERKRREKDVSQLRKERDQLQTRLRSLEGEFRAVKRRLDAARRPAAALRTSYSAPGPNGMVFPVSGSYYYADTWGASRSGGRRRHQGTDIMAPHGTPCVAVLSGTITSKEGGLGGRTIWLRADNGWSFYYAHLQGWAVRSGRVSAGQVIGYVGSTGNATASAPHLHFEIHPGGGAAVNPYPYLRAME